MNLGQVLRRIASITSILRARGEDGIRVLTHGGTVDELQQRMDARAASLERVRGSLEKRING